MHWDIGGFKPFNIEVVAAFDVDERKVGKDLSEAIFQLPNCTTVFHRNVPRKDVTVRMGRVLDSIAPHLSDYEEKLRFCVAREPEPSREDVVRILKDSGAEILLNYLPVGSEKATRFYAECALDAGIALINNIPVFIASDPAWSDRFAKKVFR